MDDVKGHCVIDSACSFRKVNIRSLKLFSTTKMIAFAKIDLSKKILITLILVIKLTIYEVLKIKYLK